MSVVIRNRKLKNGFRSYYLDVCHNGMRYTKWLKIMVSDKPVSFMEKQTRKEKLLLVEKLKYEEELRLLNFEHGQDLRLQKIAFTKFFDEYVSDCLLADKRSFVAAQKKLKCFAKKDTIYPSEITPEFLQKFKKYLDGCLNGESSYNYFKKVARVIKLATKAKLFKVNPALEIQNKRKAGKQKDILGIEEIKNLQKAYCSNQVVKNAFLLSCLTGLRFCDVKTLSWKNIENDTIDIIQQKTKQRVRINLNVDAKLLLGRRGKFNDLIFKLPSANGCNKLLRNWMKNAGIEKHITWHCGRHSFGTNLIEHNVNLIVASGLLGHTSLKETQRYVRLKDEMKQKAVDSLPRIL